MERRTSDEKFECFIQGKENLQQSKEEIVSMLADLSEKRLVELHHRYLPALTGVGLKDKAAIRLAKQIEKEYRTLGVQIRVTSAEMKEDRYIFTVDTLSRTKDTDVSKNADTIQKPVRCLYAILVSKLIMATLFPDLVAPPNNRCGNSFKSSMHISPKLS